MKQFAINTLDKYFATTASAYTLYFYNYNGIVYGMRLTKELARDRVRISRESTAKGGHATLKMNKLTNAQRVAYIVGGMAEMFATLEEIENIKKINKFVNLGCAIEHLASVRNGGNGFAKGDKRGYWEDGDIKINGENVQIKYEECSFARVEKIEEIYRERVGC